MSELLDELKEALREELHPNELHALKQSRQELSAKYREKRSSMGSKERFMQSPAERMAYLATRMPATSAVIERVAKEMQMLQPEIAINSLLDLGAGPGTASWVYASRYPLAAVTLVEQDADLIRIGQRLMAKSSASCLKAAEWRQQDLLKLDNLATYDAVILSYVLNELPSAHHAVLIQKAWNSAVHNLILIEPGTPQGFRNILAARQQLISLGAHLIAPCPHAAACPLVDSKTAWCHFSERLERTREHRLLKGGSLGYEDEKYSYLIVSKQPGRAYVSRILNTPQKRSGHIHIETCTSQGLISSTLSKKEGEIYKQAKKLDWGDILY